MNDLLNTDPYKDYVSLKLKREVMIYKGKKPYLPRKVNWLGTIPDFHLIDLLVIMKDTGQKKRVVAWKMGHEYGGRKFDKSNMEIIAWKMHKDTVGS